MKKMNLPQALRLFSFCALFALAVTGCANGNLDVDTAPSSMLSSSSGQSTSLATTAFKGFSCPSYTNIVPDGSSDLDAFTGCADSTSTSEVLLQGHPYDTSTVCVFAAEALSGGTYAVTSSSGAPYVECVNMSSGSALIAFSGISFNALYVVNPTNEQAMYSCLLSNGGETCPPYAYGEFR